MKDVYLEALENARAELSALVKQRSELDERIVRLTKSIEGLQSLCEDKGQSAGLTPKIECELSDSMGLSDAIRQILANSILPRTAPEIRDFLVAEGFEPNDYSNMLTVIHNTLRRLERQGEISKVRFPGGSFWGWTRK